MDIDNPYFGRIKTERKKRGWDVARMASELRKASDEPKKLPAALSVQRNIERWESGRVKRISERYRLLYAAVFDIPETELFPSPPPRQTRRTPASIADDEDMERRKLLGSLVALGAVSNPAFDALSDIQGSIERALGADTAAHLDDWEEALAEYEYTYLITPRAQIIPELATDLITVRSLMGRERPDTPLYRSWCRVVAGLSLLLAKALSSQQRPREARTWWTTAQQAAGTSGDVNLSLWISGESLIHGLYERRPAPILLRRANDAVGRAGDVPHPGLATVLAARAQVLAIDGRADEADGTLRDVASLVSRLPASITSDRRSLAGFGEGNVRYTEAFVHAHLGDSGRVSTAVDRALDLMPSDHLGYRTRLELLRGFGMVRAHDTTEGVRHAQRAIEANPSARTALMAATIAEDVLDAVPSGDRHSPLVGGYRELLADGGSSVVT
ncbi:helix-turn-helix domain-containing protein [Actinocorallia sp. API 0066]|uniref:helix-turn-helix domain-containing protein n=1 Tax=Actinocorallia sp. API 0066 TaxID=2896846 RepID=UPI001E466DEE|nr:helix-turn-helix domain-containing protein [Actinocorallia sp. API 0066]MCD0450385.1 helix-turn-helix domain-containing protein [Actinocorallia sp. API 0066]